MPVIDLSGLSDAEIAPRGVEKQSPGNAFRPGRRASSVIHSGATQHRSPCVGGIEPPHHQRWALLERLHAGSSPFLRVRLLLAKNLPCTSSRPSIRRLRALGAGIVEARAAYPWMPVVEWRTCEIAAGADARQRPAAEGPTSEQVHQPQIVLLDRLIAWKASRDRHCGAIGIVWARFSTKLIFAQWAWASTLCVSPPRAWVMTPSLWASFAPRVPVSSFRGRSVHSLTFGRHR